MKVEIKAVDDVTWIHHTLSCSQEDARDFKLIIHIHIWLIYEHIEIVIIIFEIFDMNS